MPQQRKRQEVSEKNKRLLYALAAGYCQYEGCDKRVIGDQVTEKIFNTGQVAHNVAASTGGARGDSERSEQLGDELENVMLLCYEHHRLVDVHDPAGHPEERLRAMKLAQEERVALACGIPPDRKSHVLVYGSSIGSHPAVLGRRTTDAALLSRGRYPASKQTLEIQMRGGTQTERSAHFWAVEQDNLEEHFGSVVRPFLAKEQDPHISVFALAAQPLLIKLGTLITDKFRVDVFQRHREPEPGWAWPEIGDGYTPFAPRLTCPADTSKRPALAISLTDSLAEERITAVMGEDCSIWHVRIEEPNHHCIRTPRDLSTWRKFAQRTLDRIRGVHGHQTPLHVFPAMPNSAAVALGLVRQEKVAMPFCLYDALPKQDFTYAFEIH